MEFEITTLRPRNARAPRFSALANVADVIVVSSGKGGVGKSTVSVNLAFRCDCYSVSEREALDNERRKSAHKCVRAL